MPILEVEHIQKSFGKTDVLKDISFSLEKRSFVAVELSDAILSAPNPFPSKGTIRSRLYKLIHRLRFSLKSVQF